MKNTLMLFAATIMAAVWATSVAAQDITPGSNGDSAGKPTARARQAPQHDTTTRDSVPSGGFPVTYTDRGYTYPVTYQDELFGHMGPGMGSVKSPPLTTIKPVPFADDSHAPATKCARHALTTWGLE
jgi:hypothetical protein